MPDPLRVALYARVSTDDKGQDPETQLMPLREHAAFKGWQAVEYVDRASAADLRGRREWRRLLDDAGAHRLDLVIAWKLDRIGRSTIGILTALQQFDAMGVRFFSLTEALDTTTPMGRFAISVLAAVAEMERDLIRERVTAGMARARKEGRKFGRKPRGWEPQEHRRWLETVRLVESGALTRREAARRLKVRYGDFTAALTAHRKGGIEKEAPDQIGSGRSRRIP